MIANQFQRDYPFRNLVGSARELEKVPPSQLQILEQCQAIQAKWDEREKTLRQLRAQMACAFGVCRNV